MTISRLRTFLAALLLLLAVLACDLPLQTASAPAPTADTVLLATIVAETFSAALQQTAEAASPASTPTQPPVIEETSTPEPPAVGSALTPQEDGTTKYSDYDAGFEVAFPVGWLAVRPNSEEFNAALENEGADNQMLRDQMTTDQAGYDANRDRLYSYPLRPDIEQDVIFGFSKLAWDQEDAVPLDNDTMGQLVRDLEGQGGIPRFRAAVAQVYANVNGVTVIEIGGPFALDDGQGGTVSFYAMIIFFKPTPDSLTRLTFTILPEHQAFISSDVKSVIGSIKLLGQ